MKDPQQRSCLDIWLQVGNADVWRGPSAWNLPAIKAWATAHGEAVRTADIELLGEAPYESAEGRAALLLTLVPALTNVLVRRPATGSSPAGREHRSVAPCLEVITDTLEVVLT